MTHPLKPSVRYVVYLRLYLAGNIHGKLNARFVDSNIQISLVERQRLYNIRVFMKDGMNLR